MSSIPAWWDTAASVSNDLTVSAGTFDHLRWAAKWAGTTQSPLAARLTQAKRVLLDRIINNSDAIKEMFKRFDDSMQPLIGKTRLQLLDTTLQSRSYVIAPDDLIRLQKIWDIGRSRKSSRKLSCT